MKKFIRLLLPFLWLIIFSNAFSATYPEIFSEELARQRLAIAGDKFVVANDGQLIVDGTQVFLWGYNLQSGVFKSYGAIDDLVERLAFSGSTAVRLWPTAGLFYSRGDAKAIFPIKGDGSDFDRYDYLVSKLAKKGIYIHNTALHFIEESVITKSNDPGIKQIFAGVQNGARIRELQGIAPYISNAYFDLLRSHIKSYLTHRNPYTGNIYAEEPVFSGWELANETSFVHCMLNVSCISALPSALRLDLQVALDRYLAAKSMPSKHWSVMIRGKGGLDGVYQSFVIEQFVIKSKELKSFSQSFAQPDKGIAVQPFSYGSQAWSPLLAARIAQSSGDLVEVGAYQTPLDTNQAASTYPFQTMVRRGPKYYNFNFGGVEGKPVIVYENSFFRPYPYRADWGPAMGIFARLQGWSGVFLYAFGHPSMITSKSGGVDNYSGAPIPTPATLDEAKPHNVYTGFHHGGDPIGVGSWVAGGLAFLNRDGLQPATVTIDVGNKALTTAGGSGYDLRNITCPDYPKLNIDSLDLISSGARLQLRFDFSKNILLQCKLCCEQLENGDSQSFQILPNVTWDKSIGLISMRQRQLKGVVGFVKGSFVLGDGISVNVRSGDFGSIVISAKSTATGYSSFKVVASGMAENSGYNFDPGRVRFDIPFGAIGGVLNKGSLPVVQKPLLFDITLPTGDWLVRKYDFSGYFYKREVINNKFTVSAGESFFYATIERVASAQ